MNRRLVARGAAASGAAVLALALSASSAAQNPEPPPTASSADGGVESPPPAEAPVEAPADPPPAPPAEAEEDPYADETVLVVSDPFARWDGTRWFIKTEIGMPIPMTFMAERNHEFRSYAFQIRTILACEKDWKYSKKLYWVNCTVEDFALRAAVKEVEHKHVQAILDEFDAKLTHARLQLQVADNGRVTNIDLEGVEHDNEREAQIHETLRLLLSRVAVGFDMRLQKWNTLQPGLWTEYSSRLMSMPVYGDTTMGTSVLLHKLERMDGNLVVQSRGKGVISSRGNNWQTELSGVSVYDKEDGYMTERVWTLAGLPSAGSWVAENRYWHAGRIVQLDPDEKPSVGITGAAALPCCPREGVPPWVPLEE